ncbi:MAG: hypothetical protein ACR2NR_07970 [Solirubrobacteraceae bacterium]
MATRDQVLRLLEHGHSYESAARELGIPAGQAFMVVTGVPADASGTPTPPEPAGQHRLDSSSQPLVSPPVHKPTRNARVIEWVRARAARDLRQDA